MDYKNFTKRSVAYERFVKIRRELLDSADHGNFNEQFTDLCAKAMQEDCVSQDCVAYFFNKGVPNYLKPNFEYYMSWQILAGANGNEFALEKLEFFLNSALEIIVNDTGLIRRALVKKNITKDNALFVISNLICEGIVDELKLKPKNLINISTTSSLYSPDKNRPFLEAMEKCLPKVVEFLIS